MGVRNLTATVQPRGVEAIVEHIPLERILGKGLDLTTKKEHQNPLGQLLLEFRQFNDEILERPYEHSVRVAYGAMALTYLTGRRPDEILTIGLIGLFHDIGKLKIDPSILNKKGLTEHEEALIREHPINGYFSVKEVLPRNVGLGVAAHHWFDGYPTPQEFYEVTGATPEKILHLSRYVSIMDGFDVGIKGRHYRPSIDLDEIVRTLKAKMPENSGLIDKARKMVSSPRYDAWIQQRVQALNAYLDSVKAAQSGHALPYDSLSVRAA